MRRDFKLPEEDEDFLNSLGYPWETMNDQRMQWLLIHNYPICEGYTTSQVDIAIKIETGYPRTQLDMAYFSPHIQRKDNHPINALSFQSIEGKSYQRWSRHRTGANPWIIGVDNVCTHLGYICSWFEAEFKKIPYAIPA
jgi:hypothetical protein